VTQRKRKAKAKRSTARQGTQSSVERTASAPSAVTKAVSILDAAWDGLTVQQLRAELMADHRRRVKATDGFSQWDQRLLCRYMFRGLVTGHSEHELLEAVGADYPFFIKVVKAEFLEDELKIARRMHARALASRTVEVARGRDPVSREIAAHIDRVLQNEIRRAVRKYKKHRDGIKLAFELMGTRREIKELDRNLIARNKLMMDADRWIAKTGDPESYGERSTLGLQGGMGPTDDGVPFSMTVQFIDPSGIKIDPGADK
jgi:hypothetical protein